MALIRTTTDDSGDPRPRICKVSKALSVRSSPCFIRLAFPARKPRAMRRKRGSVVFRKISNSSLIYYCFEMPLSAIRQHVFQATTIEKFRLLGNDKMTVMPVRPEGLLLRDFSGT
jgi:hypothetical protein